MRSLVVIGFFALGARGKVTFRVDWEAETISMEARRSNDGLFGLSLFVVDGMRGQRRLSERRMIFVTQRVSLFTQ